MAQACHLVEINVPADKIHAALTTVEGLRGWWTKSVDIVNNAPKTYHFRFGSEAHNKMKIIKEEMQTIEWECIDGHNEWIGTRLLFQIESISRYHLQLPGNWNNHNHLHSFSVTKCCFICFCT